LRGDIRSQETAVDPYAVIEFVRTIDDSVPAAADGSSRESRVR